MRLVDGFMAGVGAAIVSWEWLGFGITAACVAGLAAWIVADALVDIYRERRQRAVVLARWALWDELERRRWIDWAFTPWSDPEFTDVHDYRRAGRLTPEARAARPKKEIRIR